MERQAFDQHLRVRPHGAAAAQLRIRVEQLQVVVDLAVVADREPAIGRGDRLADRGRADDRQQRVTEYEVVARDRLLEVRAPMSQLSEMCLDTRERVLATPEHPDDPAHSVALPASPVEARLN